jgi:glutamyl-tRNA synthetase
VARTVNAEELSPKPIADYRGRIAPTPTGYLHLGHARTFWIAAERCRRFGGQLVFRNEDLDRDRCRIEYAVAAMDDLRWLGLQWDEGPDLWSAFAPYDQSQRMGYYVDLWRRLAASGAIYPSPHSRKDVERALTAPHEGDSEPVFPVELRPEPGTWTVGDEPEAVNYRFRVPDGESITFIDGAVGPVTRTAGIDFGDFLVWRKDGFPSYELAVVADDAAMLISEVVRGEDLLTSTARQLLLYRAVGWTPPSFFHCPLMRDESGVRLAKRDGALSLRTLREQGVSAESLRARFVDECMSLVERPVAERSQWSRRSVEKCNPEHQR